MTMDETLKSLNEEIAKANLSLYLLEESRREYMNAPPRDCTCGEALDSKTLWEKLNKLYKEVTCDTVCSIVEEWISQHPCNINGLYSEGYNAAMNTLKENLFFKGDK